MAYYMQCSAKIYEIYLKYVAPEDIHVYSIDEVFIDATSYLQPMGLTAREFAKLLMREVLEETGRDGHHGDGGRRHQSLSVQGRHGYRRKARRAR